MAKKEITKNVNKFLFTPEPEETNTKESYEGQHIEKIVEEIYSTDDIEVKTDLNDAEIKAIAKGQIFADRYNCNVVEKLCNKIMVLKVSKGRLGRKEFKDIAQSIQNPAPEEALPITMKERFFGKE